MSRVTCPGCGMTDISSVLITCPNCDFPIKEYFESNAHVAQEITMAGRLVPEKKSSSFPAFVKINNKSLCRNCFSESTTGPCPYCGFDPKTYTHDSMTLDMGTVLNDRYLIGGVIGKGGFGITYLGYDQRMGARVAIKEYYPVGIAVREPGRNSISKNGSSGHQISESVNQNRTEYKTVGPDRAPVFIYNYAEMIGNYLSRSLFRANGKKRLNTV